MRGITWLIIIWTGLMAFVFIGAACAATGAEEERAVMGYVFVGWFGIFVALSLTWIMTKMDARMKQNSGQPVGGVDSPEEPTP